MKALIIDYNGPVIDAKNFFENRSRRIAKIFNIKWAKELQDLWMKLYIDASAGKISVKKYYTSLAKFANKKLNGDEDKKFIEHEKLADKKIPVYISSLKKKFGRKLKVGLLSNYVNIWITPILKKYKLQGYFDAVIVSDKIKIRKPDARAYKIIAKKLNVKTLECVYVSDELDDLEGASAAGMEPVFIKGEDTETNKFPKIANLGEVEKFLI